jgi:hypothetical protein
MQDLRSSLLFWIVTSCGLVGRKQHFGGMYCPEDGDSLFLRNVSIYIRVRTASEPRRTMSTFLLQLLSQ